MFELFWIDYGRDSQKGLAWNHEKCKWTGSEANWFPLWCDPLPLRFGGKVNICHLQISQTHVTSTWWVVWAGTLTVSREVVSRPGAEVCLQIPLHCQLHPRFLSGKNCMEQLVLIISSMAKAVRNTFILVTHSNTYTFTHIYLHMLFLCVVCMPIVEGWQLPSISLSECPLMSCRQNLP